jgi:hypothetical protein
VPASRRVLVLYWHDGPPTTIRSAIRRHLTVLEEIDDYEVVYYNVDDGPPPAWMRFLRFHAIVFHTLFLTVRWHHNFAQRRPRFRWLGDYAGPKIALPQDEYDDAEVLDEWLEELGADTIFTIFDEDTRPRLYPRMHRRAAFRQCLTGYVDERAAKRFQDVDRIASREVDLVYRAAHLQYWFGRQGQQKHRVGAVMREAAERRGLHCDISTRPEDTIVGESWFRFLASGRAALGCESGSSCLDRRSEIKGAVKALLEAEPHLSFEEVAARLPAGWDDHRFLAISPRHFEAAVTRTAQVLVEGRYSGVLEPERHYIPLRPDFSNADEVVERLRDHPALERMAERAWEDLIASQRYSYGCFAREIRDAIEGASPRTEGRIRVHLPLSTPITRRLAGRHCAISPLVPEGGPAT